MQNDDLEDIPVNDNHETTLENDLPTVTFVSFGHRRGPLNPTPHLSIDLRSLPNPPKAMRGGQTGVSKTIRDWIFTEPGVRRKFESVCREVQRCLDTAIENEQTDVLVGVNCEVGKHRSVAFVEELGRVKFKGWNVLIAHRDAHLKRSSHKHVSHARNDNEEH